mmetsp:Transcript_1431/g.2122  ORF Transcript_1431/g.2122 Transcript_1431/m.2122 type:complete len:514 (-) Transcript_1431:406-1947(-)
MRNYRGFMFAFFCVLLFLVQTFGAPDHNEDKLDEYFYLNEDASLIHETLASQGVPPFLEPSYPKIRIVEFYAHWCPHCQHFKLKYIKFANELQNVIKELKLDLEVETAAVSCVPHKNTCASWKLKGYPTIKLFLASNSSITELTQFDLEGPRHFLKILGNRTGHRYDTGYRHQSDLQSRSTYFMDRTNHEIFSDAHLSLQFLLDENLYMSEAPLAEGRQKNVLENFLQILQETVPSSCSMQPLLKDLLAKFDKVSSGQDGLANVVQPHRLNTTWSPSCKKHGTGFTCGLWSLFHILSVGFVKWNQLNPWNPDLRLSSGQIGDALRDFIEFYLRCEVCVDHFLYEYDSCDYDRCNRFSFDKDTDSIQDWMEFPLWLFEMHNGVNARLRIERLEENQDANDLTTEFEVIWPPRDQCESCWISEGRWEELGMYVWLSEQYWLDSDKVKDNEKKNAHPEPKPRAEKSFNNQIAKPKILRNLAKKDGTPRERVNPSILLFRFDWHRNITEIGKETMQT